MLHIGELMHSVYGYLTIITHLGETPTVQMKEHCDVFAEELINERDG